MIFAVSKLYYLKNIFFSDCLPYFKTPLGCSRAPVCFLLLSITLASVTTPELIRALLYMSISETGHPAGWRINTHTHTHTHTHISLTHTHITHTHPFLHFSRILISWDVRRSQNLAFHLKMMYHFLLLTASPGQSGEFNVCSSERGSLFSPVCKLSFFPFSR